MDRGSGGVRMCNVMAALKEKRNPQERGGQRVEVVWFCFFSFEDWIWRSLSVLYFCT